MIYSTPSYLVIMSHVFVDAYLRYTELHCSLPVYIPPSGKTKLGCILQTSIAAVFQQVVLHSLKSQTLCLRRTIVHKDITVCTGHLQFTPVCTLAVFLTVCVPTFHLKCYGIFMCQPTVAQFKVEGKI